ncbi:hypothetical protein HanIR_Chr10g0463601 [Helianthus annuus]|nr:hypothetical protein HanIR_Chr10g0463601 [Helianthus annuus]
MFSSKTTPFSTGICESQRGTCTTGASSTIGGSRGNVLPIKYPSHEALGSSNEYLGSSNDTRPTSNENLGSVSHDRLPNP